MIYIIIYVIVALLIAGIGSAVVDNRTTKLVVLWVFYIDDSIEIVLIALLWPFILAITPIILIVKGIYYLTEIVIVYRKSRQMYKLSKKHNL
jgi:hypothetical protein